MKKVLVVGFFSPFRKGGSGRMLGIAKYLSSFDWKPYILTAPLETRPQEEKGRYEIIEVPYRGDVFWPLRKFFSLFGFRAEKNLTEQIKTSVGSSSKKTFIDWLVRAYQELFGYPDTERLWRGPAMREARALMEREHMDAVLSIWPISTHFVAKKVKEEFSIPWVADFPDPWSENHDYAYGKIRKWFDRRIELDTVCASDALTAASPSYAKKQNILHKRPVVSIPNGFDTELLAAKRPPLTRTFSITYAGTIYKASQDPTRILRALGNLVRKGIIMKSDAEIRFYGTSQAWIDEAIRENGLSEIAKQFGPLPKDEVFAKECESQLLLLLGWEKKGELGVYPMKLFEYLAAERPIMVTGGAVGEEIKTIVNDMGTGAAGIEVEEIENILAGWYREFKKNGSVGYHGKKERVNEFSYTTMAKRFAEVLDGCVMNK